jgi:RNA polymerase sigma-70 factor (ECF subfamily)
VLAFAPRFWEGVEIESAMFNGEHAMVLRREGVVFGAIMVNASAHGIDQVLWLMNPAKLAAVN